jgi:GNAT superfamily N-acetyltransferase
MITKIGENEISSIQEIARITWPVAFKDILSKEQLAFMMELMYNENTLNHQIKNGHEFYLYNKDEKPIGFIGIEPNCNSTSYTSEKVLKIHKLYILPEFQGQKIGEQLIRFIELRAKELNQEKIILNVNRFNKALYFYQKLEFKIIQTVDIEIGMGYLMEDFILEKQIY